MNNLIGPTIYFEDNDINETTASAYYLHQDKMPSEFSDWDGGAIQLNLCEQYLNEHKSNDFKIGDIIFLGSKESINKNYDGAFMWNGSKFLELEEYCSIPRINKWFETNDYNFLPNFWSNIFVHGYKWNPSYDIRQRTIDGITIGIPFCYNVEVAYSEFEINNVTYVIIFDTGNSNYSCRDIEAFNYSVQHEPFCNIKIHSTLKILNDSLLDTHLIIYISSNYINKKGATIYDILHHKPQIINNLSDN